MSKGAKHVKAAAMCHDHPQAAAVAKCVACHKQICVVCRTEMAGHPYCPLCTSQLIEESVNLAVVKGEAAHERRRFPRVSTVIPVQYQLEERGEAYHGVLVNINVGGAGFITQKRLREQTQFYLTFTLPNQTQVLTVQAGVMHTKDLNDSFNYSGVTFMNLGDTLAWIENFMRARTTRKYVKLDKKVSFV